MKTFIATTEFVLRDEEEFKAEHPWHDTWEPRANELAACGELPVWFPSTLKSWIVDRNPPGGFFQNVLANNFSEAVGAADETSTRCLRNIMLFLYNYTPSDCHGSCKKVVEWCSPKYLGRLEPRGCTELLQGEMVHSSKPPTEDDNDS